MDIPKRFDVSVNQKLRPGCFIAMRRASAAMLMKQGRGMEIRYDNQQ